MASSPSITTSAARRAGRHVLKLCRAEACQATGGDALAARAQARLGVALGDTTADGRVTLEPVYCLGLCSVVAVGHDRRPRSSAGSTTRSSTRCSRRPTDERAAHLRSGRRRGGRRAAPTRSRRDRGVRRQAQARDRNRAQRLARHALARADGRSRDRTRAASPTARSSRPTSTAARCDDRRRRRSHDCASASRKIIRS